MLGEGMVVVVGGLWGGVGREDVCGEELRAGAGVKACEPWWRGNFGARDVVGLIYAGGTNFGGVFCRGLRNCARRSED